MEPGFSDASSVSDFGGLAESDRIAENLGMADHSLSEQVTPEAEEGSKTPRLRLAGTTAGPLSQTEQALLDLRQALIHASGHLQRDAVLIRGRLERSGRIDPIESTTGGDVFERSQVELGKMLAAVERQLEAESGPRIEVVPGVESLLRRP